MLDDWYRMCTEMNTKNFVVEAGNFSFRQIAHTPDNIVYACYKIVEFSHLCMETRHVALGKSETRLDVLQTFMLHIQTRFPQCKHAAVISSTQTSRSSFLFDNT